MISEVDVAKKCYQIWHKVAKLPKKCYQMWQNVAKGVPRGFKGLQVVSRGSKGKCYQMWQKNGKGVPRESATRSHCKVEHFFRSSQILGNAFHKIPTRMHLKNLLDIYFAMMKLNVPVIGHKSFQVWSKFT